MNTLKKKLMCISALISTTYLCNAGTTTNIVPRSQSFNAARQMIGWNNPEWGINRYPQDAYYSSFNLTFAYTRTFRNDDLTRCLFGDDVICGPCDDLGIKISGSAIADRASTDWLAEYFGLPRDFQSTVTFNPTISNFILDFSFYAGLDAWIDGLYFRIHGPFVHTSWNLNAQESVCSEGTEYLGSYFQGYFSDQVEPISEMNKNFLSYTNGAVPSLEGITWENLCCSKIKNSCDCSTLSRNGFGELRMVLGYNFLNDASEQYHAGIGIYAAAPTGTSVGEQGDCDSTGRYLFEPIVGNGKHWELGAQVTAHHIFWNSKDDSKSVGVYVEANVTHLFGASQIRCFDLLSAGSNSRYMIAQLLESNKLSETRLDTNTDPLSLEFANAYAPVANLTQRSVKTSIAVQGDIAISLAYQSEGFQWDLGYNFWGRTCENICIENCCPADQSFWALKGDNRVYGFENYTDVKVRLAATDNTATINAGSNMRNGVDYTGANPLQPINAYADSPILARTNNNESVFPTDPVQGDPLYTSLRPITLLESNFDLRGTRGTSNKVFTNFNWAWTERYNTWTPYLSVGGEVEFGGTSSNCCNINECENSCKTNCGTNCGSTVTSEYTNPCNTTPACTGLPRRAGSPEKCIDCALSQWGIWLKVGASYN